MRKAILLGTLCLSLVSCSNDSKNDFENNASLNTSNSFLESIVSVSKRYGYRGSASQNHSIQYASNPDNTQLKDKKSEYGWFDIAVADAEGGLVGGMEGYKEGGKLGAAVGAVCGAAYKSVKEFVDQTNKGNGGGTGGEGGSGGGDDGNGGNEKTPYFYDGRSPIDLRNPINDISDFSSHFDPELRPYVRIGQWHGSLCSELSQDSQFMSLDSNLQFEYLLKYVDANCKSDMITDFGFTDEIGSMSLVEYFETIGAFSPSSELSNMTFGQLLHLNDNLFDAFKVYHTTLKNINYADIYSYTNMFMKEVHSNYMDGNISEQDALLINSAVAVFLNSNLLWNRFIPKVHGHNGYLFKSHNQWFYTRNKAAVLSELSNGEIQYLGIPNIVKDSFSEIFFFDSFEEYTYWFGYAPTALMPNEQLFINYINLPPNADITNNYDLVYHPKPLDFCVGIHYYSLAN